LPGNYCSENITMSLEGEMDINKIRRCLHNDRIAQKELYDLYKTNMFVLCQMYFCDREEAKDALQEGFIKVFRDLYQYDHIKGALGSWIRKVMVNTCLEKLRKNKVNFQPIDDLNANVGYESDIFSDLTVKDLTKLIQLLPIGYRTVFNLYVIEGYTHMEIAEQLNISENTSKTQLMKAKNMLRNKIEAAFK
jgi:RNA polymerase sigma factor (sigma-70 family)